MSFARRRPLLANLVLVLLVFVLARYATTLGTLVVRTALILTVLMALQAAIYSESDHVRNVGPHRRLLRVFFLRAIGFAALSPFVVGSYSLQTIYFLGYESSLGNVLWLLLPLGFSVVVDTLWSRPYPDEYWTLGKLIVTGRHNSFAIAKDLGASVIKVFFYPLMFAYGEVFIDRFSNLRLPDTWTAFQLYDVFSIGYILIDVIFAASAYALSLKIIDNRVRSVNPYPSAWFVTFVCYSPFWGIAERLIIFQWREDWRIWLENGTYAQWLWLSLILGCFGIYAWSTVAMGPRFSNLTYRGTVESGPYRFMKHPAYVSKVISYWLITVPFIPLHGWAFAVQQCVMLSISCSLYYFRAKLEERHLMQFTEYKAYATGAG